MQLALASLFQANATAVEIKRIETAAAGKSKQAEMRFASSMIYVSFLQTKCWKHQK